MNPVSTDELFQRCETALYAAETILRRSSLDGQIAISSAAEFLFGPDHHGTHYQRLLAEIETLKDQIADHQGW